MWLFYLYFICILPFIVLPLHYRLQSTHRTDTLANTSLCNGGNQPIVNLISTKNTLIFEKMENAKTHMRHLRDREFLAVYRQVAQEMMQGKEPFVRREAIRRTLERGKPLYYLSYNRTYTVMLHYMSTGDVPLKARQQRAMWLEIGAAVKREMAEHPELTMPQAIARVLATAHASRFYLSEAYAYKLLYRIVHERRQAAANKH